ncbi:hypothetical protein TNCV_3547291 [Trichonephila clavipes]|nr:hypothetical protein TNCV_3547291 [Trichonephila clavipes]
MTSHHRLDDSLRWRAVGILEAGQSQLKVVRSLQVASRLWNQFQTSGAVTRKISQDHLEAKSNALRVSEKVNINVKLFSYTRAFGDGPRNFEPWSSDDDDT